ncbi:MAG: tryptophan 7-halogenase [Arenicella sp.]|nr:tryptophan 7-halogenase [Arenicella sp.]
MNEHAKQSPSTIIIVGGGTAGWMSANLMAHAWPGSRITVVESSDISPIGVGEGSTPYLKLFFQKLDIPESEWMPQCDATYKCGIKFTQWSTNKGFERYFHPFFSPLDIEPASGFFKNCTQRRRGYNINAHPDNYFVSTAMSRHNKAPHPYKTLPFDVDYGYHFDAGLLGSFLKKKAIEKKVTHVIDHIELVEVQHQKIVSLKGRVNDEMNADLFVDCSGFSSRLINKALNEPLISYNETLLNDRAVAISTHPKFQELPSSTVSAALNHGWCWHIPLQSRTGHGYVYSSEFLEPEQAEQELRMVLGDDAINQPARHLKMQLGRINHHWKSNCLAVGLSQGFVEPLEATALMTIQITIESFIAHYCDNDLKEQQRQKFNLKINRILDGVRDYISMHYKLNTRNDTPYWQAARNDIKISDSVRVLKDAWFNGNDFERALCPINPFLGETTK